MEKTSSFESIKNLVAEIWNEHGKQILVVFGIIGALFIGGGVYRVYNGEPFWGSPESAQERSTRLRECAQVVDEDLTPVQQMNSPELAGICSGFSSVEIKQTQNELGL